MRRVDSVRLAQDITSLQNEIDKTDGLSVRVTWRNYSAAKTLLKDFNSFNSEKSIGPVKPSLRYRMHPMLQNVK